MSARTLTYSGNVVYRNYERKWEAISEREKAQSSYKGFYRSLSSNVVLLLYGLAIENFVKGLLIANGISPFKEDGKLNSDLKTHDLNRLFTQAGLPRTPDDEALLNPLWVIIEAGKYPVAANKEVILHRDHPYIKGRTISSIRQHALNLLKCLESQLRAKTPSLTEEMDGVTFEWLEEP